MAQFTVAVLCRLEVEARIGVSAGDEETATAKVEEQVKKGWFELAWIETGLDIRRYI